LRDNNSPTSSILSPDSGDLLVAAAKDRSVPAASADARRVPIGAAPEFSIDDDSAVVTPLQRWLVASHFAVTLASLWTSLASLHVASLHDYLSIAGVFILSVVAGDFGTGVFHWSVDNYGSLKTPVVGSVCAAFQGHHKAPWTITFRPFVNNVYKIALGTIPALLLTVAVVADHHQRMFLTLFINWWLVSQEFHKYAHMKRVPPVVRFLQDRSIILSRKEHGLHHNSPFEGNYCILNGVCNRLLDRTSFFRKLERIVFQITGTKPLTWLHDEEVERKAMSTGWLEL